MLLRTSQPYYKKKRSELFSEPNEMAERQTKVGLTRKRALVSCDRCKLRRARCIRDNADVPCADCKMNGIQCESRIPRKQRVYGSVETLSLHYRALESLLSGLFPHENIQNLNTLFRIAAIINIQCPPETTSHVQISSATITTRKRHLCCANCNRSPNRRRSPRNKRTPAHILLLTPYILLNLRLLH